MKGKYEVDMEKESGRKEEEYVTRSIGRVEYDRTILIQHTTHSPLTICIELNIRVALIHHHHKH